MPQSSIGSELACREMLRGTWDGSICMRRARREQSYSSLSAKLAAAKLSTTLRSAVLTLTWGRLQMKQSG